MNVNFDCLCWLDLHNAELPGTICIHAECSQSSNVCRFFWTHVFKVLSASLFSEAVWATLNLPTTSYRNAFIQSLPCRAANAFVVCIQDTPRNMRFSINFFTSIGLGPVTDGAREHLKNLPRLIATQQPAASDSDSDSSSGELTALSVDQTA